jgi:hypothetical protein
MKRLREEMFSVGSVLRLYGKVVWKRLDSLQVRVGRSPACKDLSQEEKERPPLEAVTEQRD